MTERVAPAIVCSVCEPDAEATRRRLENLPRGSDLVEIRADRLTKDEVGRLIGSVERPVIVTARRSGEGGAFEGPEEDRIELLEQALAAGAAFIDVEQGSPAARLAEGPRASRVILSHHGEPCRAERLVALYRRMAGSSAARLKIVPRAETAAELRVVRDLLARSVGERRALACFAVGRAGMLSRLLAPAWGSWATYGAWGFGRETGEGQFTVAELDRVYDARRIGPATRLYALVGRAVRSSPSPAMHMASYRELGLDARYLPIEIDRLEELLPLLEPGSGCRPAGLAVTMPLKEPAARRAVPADAVSRASRAVNTVVLDGTEWRGYNTDGPAAVELARKLLRLRGAPVAIVGAGGTGRALAVAFSQAGAAVTLFNRSRRRAEVAARDLGVEARPLAELPCAGWELLAQATPLGREGESVLPEDCLTGRAVLDVVYGPRPTPLVRAARSRGLGVVDGFEFLVAQAVLQFERLTGQRPEPGTLASAGREWLSACCSGAS